ncbi:MAG: hypothetical protein WBE80_01475 [Methylocella sp.]
MMFLLGYMAAPPTILVISAEAMPEMPAAARKNRGGERLARKFHDVLLLGITGLIVRHAGLYGSRGRKVSSALKCLQAGIAAAEPPGQSIMPIAARAGAPAASLA